MRVRWFVMTLLVSVVALVGLIRHFSANVMPTPAEMIGENGKPKIVTAEAALALGIGVIDINPTIPPNLYIAVREVNEESLGIATEVAYACLGDNFHVNVISGETIKGRTYPLILIRTEI
jgi:hypothetical protein